MSLFAAWTDKDCYKAKPYLVTEEKWIECKTSKAKLGLLFSAPIIIIVIILIAIFAPMPHKIIFPLIGIGLIIGQIVGLFTIRASAEAEHEVAMQPIKDMMDKDRTLNLTEAVNKYDAARSEIDKNYMLERSAKAQASGLTSAAGIVAAAFLADRQKK